MKRKSQTAEPSLIKASAIAAGLGLFTVIALAFVLSLIIAKNSDPVALLTPMAVICCGCGGFCGGFASVKISKKFIAYLFCLGIMLTVFVIASLIFGKAGLGFGGKAIIIGALVICSFIGALSAFYIKPSQKRRMKKAMRS